MQLEASVHVRELGKTGAWGSISQAGVGWVIAEHEQAAAGGRFKEMGGRVQPNQWHIYLFITTEA